MFRFPTTSEVPLKTRKVRIFDLRSLNLCQSRGAASICVSHAVRPGLTPRRTAPLSTIMSLTLRPNESNIFKTVSRELCPSDAPSQQTVAVIVKAPGAARLSLSC